METNIQDISQQEHDKTQYRVSRHNGIRGWGRLSRYDTQQDMAFAARKCTQYYDVSDTTAYQYYRLCVTEVNGSSDISLGEWQLFSRLSTGIIPVHAQGSEMRLEGDKLSVSGAAGSQLRVYTLDGILEQHTTLKGSRCRLTLRPGWHLCVLTNGRMKAVRKVYVLR